MVGEFPTHDTKGTMMPHIVGVGHNIWLKDDNLGTQFNMAKHIGIVDHDPKNNPLPLLDGRERERGQKSKHINV